MSYRLRENEPLERIAHDSELTTHRALPGAETDRPSGGWKRWARLLILVVAVALLATHLHADDLARAFARLDAANLAIIVFVLSPLAALLRARRWHCLLAAGDRVAVLAYCGAYVVGVLTNAVLPGRFGDLVKAPVICRPGVDYARSLAVVVIDRLLEGLALLVVFAAVLLYTPLPEWASRLGWLAAGRPCSALCSGDPAVDRAELRLAGSHLARLGRRLPVALRLRLVALGCGSGTRANAGHRDADGPVCATLPGRIGVGCSDDAGKAQ